MFTSSMESTASTSRTELLPSPSSSTHTPPILRLRLQKKKSGKKVVWTDGTVDNEHMNKKKSKCCCIYKKPSVFGESSSEEEEECEHCFGHPEKRIKNRNHTHSEHPAPSDKDPASSNPDQLPCGSGDCQKNSQ